MYTEEQLAQHKQEFALLGEYLNQPLRLLTEKECIDINNYDKDKYCLVVNYWYSVCSNSSFYLREIANDNLKMLSEILFSDCNSSFKFKIT